MSSYHTCVRVQFVKEGAVPSSGLFGRTILLSVLGFKVEDFFFCFISFAHRFDVSFQISGRLAEFSVWWSATRSAGSLADWVVKALSDHERIVTERLYNESVSDYDVMFWLS